VEAGEEENSNSCRRPVNPAPDTGRRGCTRRDESAAATADAFRSRFGGERITYAPEICGNFCDQRLACPLRV